MPVASIPINRGKLVNDIKKPPICAATMSAIKSNTGPPGYAESPTIDSNINQAIIPESNRKILKLKICFEKCHRV